MVCYYNHQSGFEGGSPSGFSPLGFSPLGGSPSGFSPPPCPLLSLIFASTDVPELAVPLVYSLPSTYSLYPFRSIESASQVRLDIYESPVSFHTASSLSSTYT